MEMTERLNEKTPQLAGLGFEWFLYFELKKYPTRTLK